ncbi:NAD(P)H-hydrate epimerase [Pseudobutyrivibrio sp. ACV-2]|uniref:NAD(P)H-hydrate dehydratase n=1 Tax=Pseudobutyrivibrio sp. ACV-2 TaxID=1520801 RepID=UPI0008949DC7|nr:NAD(P)H-hydrate dehydratase [Pseudobutyrivibrio sp. ACV-2]SEA05608.1 NAD(P)H-hydrate epimerase [Pseudobutyrivibrio sp. ACV-2]
MKKVLSAAEMKACDTGTIEEYGIPSLVLMERAALGVCNVLFEKYPKANNIGIFCGPGNNGGDGVAIGRILHNMGYSVKMIVLGNPEKFSPQLKQEIDIAVNYKTELLITGDITMDANCFDELLEGTDLFIDAMFGIGLTRGLSGSFEHMARFINNSGKPVIAVDIPSGFDTDSGKLLGDVGVKADTTVTFAYLKKGLLLGDCKAAAGEIKVADVGIYGADENAAALLDDSILEVIPPRDVTANKGTCGKVLVIAGSENIYGACYLSANAALTTGSGLVKVYTHKNNIQSIQQNLPEAMYLGYDDFNETELLEQIKWADTILIGPGLGISEVAVNIVNTIQKSAQVPVVIDADGINIVAKNLPLFDELTGRVPVILTPHLKEMERLCGVPVKDINYDMEKVAKDFAVSHNCVVVLKNHTTVISNVNTVFYCNSGNEGLATAGSGDVLAGIITSLLGQGLSAFDAAAAGTYIHGRAGAIATRTTGIKGLLARDIIANINQLI